MPVSKLLTSKTTIFALGAVSVTVWNVAAPIIGGVVRPLLKEAIKGGILLGRQVQTLAEEAWQDVEDLTAEAKAELDSKTTGGNGSDTSA
jgi:hypothetical protein